MLKYFVGFFAVIFFIVIVFAKGAHAQGVHISATDVVYTLPYAGLLPDNPLYPFKIVRDRLLEFFTRDYLQKSRLYLLFSDKRVSMAIDLSNKGKWQLAADTLTKAELYTQKIPPLAASSKKQGSAFPDEFINTLKQSIDKHTQVIEDLIQNAPQEEQVSLQGALKINTQNKTAISSLGL